MSDKPYYNPATKETYMKFQYKNITLRFFTGSITMGTYGRPTVWRNEFGEVIKSAPYIEYVRIV